jgi:hypothetical protein
VGNAFYCAALAPDPMEQSRKFKEMMLHNKIECFNSRFETVMDLLEEYENDFPLLWDFKESRNDIGHKKWTLASLKSFRFLYVDTQRKRKNI